MTRLTEKNGNLYKLKPENEVYGWEDGIRLVQIVGRLEDLEEQLGCPLEVLFKALTNGVWVEVNPLDIDIENPETMYLEEFVNLEKKLDGTLCLNARDYVDELELKDYKKTWWLKKDKSE